MNQPTPPSQEKTQVQETGLVEWFTDEFVPRFGKQSLYVLAGVILVAGAVMYFNNSREAQQVKENKELGQAFAYLSHDQNDSAEAFLADFVKQSHSRLVQDKANLMLGSVRYSLGKYDEAIQAYGQVTPADKDRALVSSGALHGLASSHMQKKDYAKAAELLESFLARFMRKTGNPAEKVEGREVADLSPAAPNALWKLALCHRELKQMDKSKAAAEKLIRIYPETREAFEAKRFLAQIP